MASREIRIGDEVMLNSGGPYMTVERVANGQVFCMWFHQQDLKVGTFGVDLLKLRVDIEAEQNAILQRRAGRMVELNRNVDLLHGY